MKLSRYIIFIAFTAAISGCAKENSDTNIHGKKIAIEAYSPAFETSKTVLGDGGAVLWDGQESINVFCGSASSKFTSGETLSKSAIATFSGSIDATSGPLYAIYPYSYGNELYEKLTILTIPELQTATEGSFDKNAFPAVASADFGEPLHFRNVCGGFCFSLSSDKVKKVIFSGNNNERLAGKACVMADSRVPKVTDFQDFNTRITLLSPLGTLKPGVKYYISMCPTAFAEGYTVELWTENGDKYVYSDNKPKVLTRSVFGRVENIDMECDTEIFLREMVSKIDRKCIVESLDIDAASVDWIWSISDESIASVLNSEKNTCIIRYKKQDVVTLTAKSSDGKYCASKQLVFITAESSDVGCKSAVISGNLKVEPTSTFSESAMLYYSSTASTLDALKSDGTKKTLTLGTDGCFSILMEGLERETKYYCVVVSMVDDVEISSSVISFTTTKPSCPSGAVDLALSVCWATCNIGAASPGEYGGYYQWASTWDVGKTSIDISNSSYWPYHLPSQNLSSGWKKYIPSNKSSYWYGGAGSPDNKTILDLSDDVASMTLGGKWRIPTTSEWDELNRNCTWTWTTLNGVKGYKVTSNKSGYTDKYIFLPAAGYRYAEVLSENGNFGHYWSSTLNVNYPEKAYCFYFFNNNSYSSSEYRAARGLSVRPVSE